VSHLEILYLPEYLEKAVTLGNKKNKVENVLQVENMKPNILSVSQTFDQEHILIFYSHKCRIRKEGSVKLLVIAPRTSSNVYILDIKEEEKCYMSQVDQIWLWHKRMRHLSFDNMIKDSRKEEVDLCLGKCVMLLPRFTHCLDFHVHC
jgi:hypothetical protein